MICLIILDTGNSRMHIAEFFLLYFFKINRINTLRPNYTVISILTKDVFKVLMQGTMTSGQYNLSHDVLHHVMMMSQNILWLLK